MKREIEDLQDIMKGTNEQFRKLSTQIEEKDKAHSVAIAEYQEKIKSVQLEMERTKATISHFGPKLNQEQVTKEQEEARKAVYEKNKIINDMHKK